MAFRNASYVDARGTVFNNAERDQTNYFNGGPWPSPPTRPRPNYDDDDPPSFMGGPSNPSFWRSSTDPQPQPRWLTSRPQPPPHVQSSPPTLNRFAPTHSTPPSILHTERLSTSGVSFDHALANFETDISPWKNPDKWIAADLHHVNSIVEDIMTLTKSSEIEQARIPGQNILFPRLIVYNFVHLVHCARDKSLLDDFKEKLQQWKTWDGIAMLQNHQQVKGYLRDLFQRDLQLTPDLHSETFHKLLATDIVGLSARLTTTINDDNDYKKLIRLNGPGAQSLVNLLQARLDHWIDPAYKPRHVKTLVELCKASGLYPDCLILKGVEIEDDAAAGGGFGDVYKGRFGGQEIAIKILKTCRKADMVKLRKQFSCEAVTWRQLSHPNVLSFLGIYQLDGKSSRSPRVCLLSPWMENGNVMEFLEEVPDTNCVLLALDIAQGLAYLHEHLVIHGDLKGFNILISLSGRACLADFGQATTKDSKPVAATHPTRGGSGTTKWQAPELLLEPESKDIIQRNTVATDVYAFGMVCYEMFSDESPFEDIPDYKVIPTLMKGKRPSRPSSQWSETRGLNDNMWHLIEQCWDQDPSKRPAASKVVTSLCFLPGRARDERPLDKAPSTATVSQMWYNQEQHPFSALAQNSSEGRSWPSGSQTSY